MQGINSIALFGANGMLGSYVASALSDMNVSLYTRDRFNILEDNVNSLPDYDLVINCAGIIKQQQAADVDMIVVNGLFPIALKKRYAKIIQISTDCVFRSRGRRYEDEQPDAEDVYGQSKALGEVGMVIRTSIIGRGNMLSLMDWALSQSEMNGYVDHWWNGVTCRQLALYIRDIILHGEYEDKIINYHSDTVNKYQLLKMINPDAAIYPIRGGHIDRTLIGTIADKSIDRQISELWSGT